MYAITYDIEKRIKNIHDQLKNKGVSSAILDEVFVRVNENETTHNNPVALNEINDISIIKKAPYNWEEKVILIVNYSNKSHALFGDFDKTYIKFKNEVISKNNWLKSSPNLAFGFGYVVTMKNKISELRASLEGYDIEYRELSFDEFKKETTGDKCTTKTTVENNNNKTIENNKTVENYVRKLKNNDNIIINDSDSINNSDVISNVKIDKKKVSKKLIRNKWDNFENSDGFIVKKLPINKDKLEVVVIGKQNTSLDYDVKGINSVILLSEEEKINTKKQYLYLSDDMIKKIKKNDKQLAKELSSIQPVFTSENSNEDNQSGNSSKEDSS